MVCGLMRLLGFDYRPQLADLPDAKLWWINTGADYGPLATAARGKIDLGRVRAHWPDLLRLAGSIHTGAVSAHDVLRMLAHGGNPTQLGDALALKAATTWPDTSSTAAAATYAAPTTRAWRTSSARSGWS
jgi:TnpA family transposase